MDIQSFKILRLKDMVESSSGFEEYTRLKYGDTDFSIIPGISIDDVFNVGIEFILDELLELGIMFIPGIAVATNTEYIKTVIELRKFFDKDNFYNLLKNTSYRDGMVSLLESDEYDKETLVGTILESLYKLNNLSLTLGFLSNKRFIITNNDRFIMHVRAILDKPVEMDDSHILQIAFYVEKILLHIAAVKENIKGILKNQYKYEDIIKTYFVNYDTDLNKIPFVYVSKYLSSQHPVVLLNEEDIKFIKDHKENTIHHFEYFIKNNKQPTKTECILICAEFVGLFNSTNKEKVLNKLKEDILTKYQFENEEYILEIVEQMLD